MLDQKDLELLAGMINPINVQLGNINNRLDGTFIKQPFLLNAILQVCPPSSKVQYTPLI